MTAIPGMQGPVAGLLAGLWMLWGDRCLVCFATPRLGARCPHTCSQIMSWQVCTSSLICAAAAALSKAITDFCWLHASQWFLPGTLEILDYTAMPNLSMRPDLAIVAAYLRLPVSAVLPGVLIAAQLNLMCLDRDLRVPRSCYGPLLFCSASGVACPA